MHCWLNVDRSAFACWEFNPTTVRKDFAINGEADFCGFSTLLKLSCLNSDKAMLNENEELL